MFKAIYPCIIFAIIYAVYAVYAHTRQTYPSRLHCIVVSVICMSITVLSFFEGH